MNNELKPYDEYKETEYDWLESVPKHWQELTIRSITKLSNERNGRRNDLELLSVYREYGVIKKSSRDDNHNVESQDLSNYKFVDKGYLVLNKMKMWQGSLGVSKYKGIVSPAYIVCRLVGDFNFTYINYLLRSPKFKTIYNRLSYGVRVGQWDMRYDDFKNIKLYIPPIEEQEQIVKYLDFQLAKINKFIKVKKKLIAALKEQIECYVFGNENRNSTNEIMSWDTAFPSNWLVAKSSKLTKEVNIKNNSTSELIAVTQDRGVVYKKDCEQNYVSPSGDLSALKLVRNGDFVISLRSFQGGIEFSEIEGIVSPAYNVFSLRKEYSLYDYKMYYKYLFKTKMFISALNTLVSGIRDGKNINYSDFSKLLLPIPPQKTIIKVCKLIEQYESIKKKFDNELILLNEFKVSLISDVVTGKVDVRNIVIDDILEKDTEPDETEDEIIESEEDISIGESED